MANKCEELETIKIYWSDFLPKYVGCYTGFPVPPAYNIDTDTYSNNGYIYGEYIGFRPGAETPTTNTFLNGGNSLSNVNFNNVLQNFEEASQFNECRTLHDFKNVAEVPATRIEYQKELMSSTKGFFTTSTKYDQVLKEEVERMISEEYNSNRYFVIEHTVMGETIFNFAVLADFELSNSVHTKVTFELFDIADFYVKATEEEGQREKDTRSGDVSKENKRFGGMPRKDNIFFDHEETLKYLLENRSLLNDGSDVGVRKLLDNLTGEFLRGNDYTQGFMTSYGVGFQDFGNQNKFNLRNQGLSPLISKDTIELLKTYRMRGTARQTFANYMLYHMRSPLMMNSQEVLEADGSFEELLVKRSQWLKTQRKDLGNGLFLVDPKNLPNENGGFKYFTTDATEFGTGMDELFQVFDLKNVDWKMEIRDIDGMKRAVLIPTLDVNFYRFNQSELANVKFSIDRTENIAHAGVGRYYNVENDGNHEYHDAVPNDQKDFNRDAQAYPTVGVLPNNDANMAKKGYATEYATNINNATNQKFDSKTDDLQNQINELRDSTSGVGSQIDEINAELADIRANCCNEGGGGGGGGQVLPPGDGFYHPYGYNAPQTQAYGCTGSGIPYPPCPAQGSCANFHNGMDFDGGFGTDLFACFDGEIIQAFDGCSDSYSNCNGGWGNTVLLAVQFLEVGTYVFRYSHLKLNSINVKVGDIVKKGQKVGQQGNSGFGTASHLHFGLYKPGTIDGAVAYSEIYCNSEDPTGYFTGIGGQTVEIMPEFNEDTPKEERDVQQLKKELPNLKITGVNEQIGWAREWNNHSYLEEKTLEFDGTGGFYRTSLTTSQDRTRREARDTVQNIPQKAQLKLECDIIKFEKERLPFFKIRPGDIIYFDVLVCGLEYDVQKTVKSVSYVFDSGKRTYSIDYE